MRPDQRQAVRENAMYLRNVRPVDPDAVSDYVEGGPHPAAVRQVLRESAFDLGLVERDDGTFVPVDDGPLDPAFDGVDALPARHEERLEELLVERFGPEWHRGDSGAALRETLRELKARYLSGAAVEYDETAALSYAVYHLADYYAAVQHVLDELGRVGLLGRRLRVLEVGAGVGGPMLGVTDYLPDEALVEYHAVDPSAAADVFAAMAEGVGRNVHTELHRTTAEAFDPMSVGDDGESADAGDGEADGPFDVVLFANVLSELRDPVATARRYAGAVSDDGTLVLLAPADLETATNLRRVERALDDDLAVFSPTLRLWPDASPEDRGWSFDVKPDIATPRLQEQLDEGDGEFVNADVQYAHAILRPDGRRRLDVQASPDAHARMSAFDDLVSERVDFIGVKLSHDLSEGGNPLFKVSDGSEREEVFAVLARRTALNAAVVEADYGDVLAFEGGLVLWNDDEGALNVVVDDETVVDRVRAP
jgi:hypothetical protein